MPAVSWHKDEPPFILVNPPGDCREDFFADERRNDINIKITIDGSCPKLTTKKVFPIRKFGIIYKPIGEKTIVLDMIFKYRYCTKMEDKLWKISS